MRGKVKIFKTKILFFFPAFFPLFFWLGLSHLFLYSLNIWDKIIVAVSVAWIAGTAIAMYILKQMQTSGFTSLGERIAEIDYDADDSFKYLLIYMPPMLVNVSNIKSFLIVVAMVLVFFPIISRTTLLFGNPILWILGYTFFYFRTDSGIRGLGISRGKRLDRDKKVKRKQVMDGVFFVYNEG